MVASISPFCAGAVQAATWNSFQPTRILWGPSHFYSSKGEVFHLHQHRSVGGRDTSVRVTAREGGKGFGQATSPSKPRKRAPAPPQQKPDLLEKARTTLESQQRQEQAAAPGVEAGGVAANGGYSDDTEFEERLLALKSKAAERRQDKEKTLLDNAPIVYDDAGTGGASKTEDKSGAPNQTWVKVVAAAGAIVLLTVFATSDLVQTSRVSSSAPKEVTALKLSDEEKAKLQTQAASFEAVLKEQPGDVDALEGAAVSYAELGDYPRTADYLELLVKARPSDPEALRLLAETRAAMKQPDKSAFMYRRAIKAAPEERVDLLKGLVDVLFADGKQGEAVSELLAARGRLQQRQVVEGASTANGAETDADTPVQVELLLGRAYAAWSKTADAFSVYNKLIEDRPTDFRGFLAKGALLKQQGQEGDAERMFLQARYLAPQEGKRVVDQVAGRK